MPPEDHTPVRPPVPDYTLLRLIGRGSYGDVWIAHGVTGMLRAIKVVWRDRFNDVEPYEREFRGLSDFIRLTQGEARQLALLHVGRNDEAGFFYYVMELADDVVTGREIDPECYAPLTLRVLRDQADYVSTQDVLRYAIELTAGLAELHRTGLVHRDIKPSNVILVDGRPKLADIGLVSVASEAMSFVGTQGFVPPEGPGTCAADIFSLGKVLYELVTGLDRQDFPSLPIDIADRADRVEMLELNESIIKACAPLASERHTDADTLLHELRLLEAGKSVRRLRFAERGLARARRWVVVAVIVAMIAGAGAAWERHRANIESAGRQAAEAQLADLTRRTLYEASLATAQRALQTGNYRVAREALDRAIPKTGDPDLRGFEWHALHREAQGDPAEIIRSEGGPVTRLEASRDGRWMAVDNASPNVELYDQGSGAFVRSLDGIHRIAGFSPDGLRLVGTTPEYTIETWSLADGSADAVPAKRGINRPLAVHPDLPHVLYFEDGQGDAPHRLGVWNYETGKDVVQWPISQFEDNDRSVFLTAAATPDLSRVLLVTASNLAGIRSQKMRAFDMTTGEIILAKGPVSRLAPIGISPDGKSYLSRPDSLRVHTLDSTDSELVTLPFSTSAEQVRFGSHRAELLVESLGNRLILVDLVSGETIRSFNGTGSQIDAFTYSHDEAWIWSVDREGEIRRWSRTAPAASRNILQADMAPGAFVFELQVSPDSSRVLLLDTLQHLQVFDSASLALSWARDDIQFVTRVGADEVCAITSQNQLIRIDAATGETRGEIQPFGENTRVKAAVSSTSGQLILALSYSDEVALWHLTENRLLHRFPADKVGGPAGHILDFAISDDGLALSVDTMQQLSLWNARTGEVIRRAEEKQRGGRIVLSPREDHIALSSSRAAPSILSFPDLEPVFKIEGGRRNGMDFAFHPTDPLVISQFVRGSLTPVNFESGQYGAPLELPVDPGSSQRGEVSEIAYSQDGKLLATADLRGRLRIWRK